MGFGQQLQSLCCVGNADNQCGTKAPGFRNTVLLRSVVSCTGKNLDEINKHKPTNQTKTEMSVVCDVVVRTTSTKEQHTDAPVDTLRAEPHVPHMTGRQVPTGFQVIAELAPQCVAFHSSCKIARSNARCRRYVDLMLQMAVLHVHARG